MSFVGTCGIINEQGTVVLRACACVRVRVRVEGTLLIILLSLLTPFLFRPSDAFSLSL